MSDFRPDIWRLQAQFDTQGLIAALHNEDAGIRKRAAAALRALGATSAIPPLKATLEKEQDPDTRANILAALAALEHEKERIEEATEPREVSVIDRLIAQLNNPQQDKVIEAINKLGDMRNKSAAEPLIVLFNNLKVPVKVRLATAEALLKLESAPVEVALLGALRSSKWQVRRNGAAILGQMKADWAVEPLKLALQDENDVVRKTARAALRFINTSEARSALEKVGDPDAADTAAPPKLSALTTLKPPSLTRHPTPDGQKPVAAPPPTATAPLKPKPETSPNVQKPGEATPTATTAPSQPDTVKPAGTTPAAATAPLKPKPEASQDVQKPGEATPTAETTPLKPDTTKSEISQDVQKPAGTTPTAETTPLKPETVQEVQKPLETSTDGAKPEDWERPTRLSRPTQKIVWPKRVITSEDPTQIQTRPLNPKRLEEADNNPNPSDS